MPKWYIYWRSLPTSQFLFGTSHLFGSLKWTIHDTYPVFGCCKDWFQSLTKIGNMQDIMIMINEWYGLLWLYNFEFSSLSTESDLILYTFSKEPYYRHFTISIYVNFDLYEWHSHLSSIDSIMKIQAPSWPASTHSTFSAQLFIYLLLLGNVFRFCLQLRCARYNFNELFLICSKT